MMPSTSSTGTRQIPTMRFRRCSLPKSAGADCLVLCDTNGGTLPHEVEEIIARVQEADQAPFGIHAHNDAELAVANSLAAIRMGAVQVHGTINGYGERCGNANLCSIIPTLKLKMGIDCISDANLCETREKCPGMWTSSRICRTASGSPMSETALSRTRAACMSMPSSKNPLTYEHIIPELVGNRRRILVSDLAGKSNILQKAAELGIPLTKDSPELIEILKKDQAAGERRI